MEHREIESPLMTLDEAVIFFHLGGSLTKKQQKRKILNWKKNMRLPNDIFCRIGRPLYLIKSKLYSHILGADFPRFKTATLLSPLDMADCLSIPKDLSIKLKVNRVLSLIYKGHLPKSITFKIGDAVYFVKEKFYDYLDKL